MIRAGSGATEVFVGRGLLARLGEVAAIRNASGAGAIFDRTTDGLFRERVESSIRDARPFARASFPPGEASKTLGTAESLLETLARARLDRRAAVVGVGGGVVTDVAGLVASLFLRGVDWVAAPTTLLGMVDASIGGKTGVDLRAGKNLAGAFHPPRAVVADLDALDTLPRRDLAGGLAEVVKIALAADADLFAELERIGAGAFDDRRAMEAIVCRSIDRKAALVEADERDEGPRLALNLGHTTGHALEAATRYERLHHGEAVAVGLRVACECALARGALGAGVRDRVTALLDALGLPSSWPADVAPEEAMAFTLADKKSLGGRLRVVLPTGIGSAAVSESTVEELTRAARAARPRRA